MTIDEAETRILRALMTAMYMRMKSEGWGSVVYWPPTVQEFMDAYAATHASAPRFMPTRQDHDRVLSDMEWFRVLDRRQAELLFHRARGLSFGTMAQIYGRSDETVGQWYKKAIKAVWAVACGREPVPTKSNHSGMMFNPRPTRVRRGRIRASFDAPAGRG